MTGAKETIQQVKLTVTDMERSAAFYIGLLGFEVVIDAGFEVVLRRGNTYLTLNQLPAEQWTSKRNPLCDPLTITLRSREALEKVAALLDKHGVRHSAIHDLGELGFKQHTLTVYDPDGHELELTAPHGELTTRIHQVLAL